MTRKEIEQYLINVAEQAAKVVREADPEIDFISIDYNGGHINVRAYRNEDVGPGKVNPAKDYKAYATRFENGNIWFAEKWAEIDEEAKRYRAETDTKAVGA